MLAGSSAGTDVISGRRFDLRESFVLPARSVRFSM
jgi:hypothetical protein